MANLRWRDQKNKGVQLAKSSGNSTREHFRNAERNIILLKQIKDRKSKQESLKKE